MAKRNRVRGPQQGAPGVSRVVYGPQGSGKGLHSQVIADHLGLQHIRDLDDVQFSGDRLQRRGHLYLAFDRDYAQRAADLIGSELLPFASALAMISAGSKGVANV
ncbi:TPA: hypothetical protein ACG46E_000936 [Stenotrophomonas maltophilia]|nr:hypothetical protein [Stenotrophomonas maltophilia]